MNYETSFLASSRRVISEEGSEERVTDSRIITEQLGFRRLFLALTGLQETLGFLFTTELPTIGSLNPSLMKNRQSSLLDIAPFTTRMVVTVFGSS